MVQSLELTLDRRADAAVRAQWDALVEAGLPSLARNAAPTNRPHVTLDTRDDVTPEADAELDAVATRLPLSIGIGATLLFHARRRWVLARHVVVDRPLIDLHAHAHEVLGPDGSPLTATGSWVPHLTLARGLSDEQLPAALAVVAQAVPLTATALRLRRWDSDEERAWDVERRSVP